MIQSGVQDKTHLDVWLLLDDHKGKIHVLASYLVGVINLLLSLWKSSNTLIGSLVSIIIFLASRCSFMTFMETKFGAPYISSNCLSLSSFVVLD